ncbi:MAG: cobalamin-independent methionine synthase II family protein [Candidatus Odyssella sp.]|nr:cobalamin-independent methionine synthase II family protein [Candidatus Odyssella sp.]
MKRSTDRILTTHVGSLPRPPGVVEFLMKKEKGETYDTAQFAAAVKAAVAEVVTRQAAAGLDVVSDGETGKIGYATYMQERLNGFAGHNERKIALDLVDYPAFREKMARVTGVQAFTRAACVAPITVKDWAPLERDIANFRAALAGAAVAEGFLNSASPGLVSAFQPNRYYKTHEAYIEAIAAAMREEYRAIVDAGFLLQLDCPDLAMARHTGFQDLSESEFLKRAEFHVEAMNHALAGIPAEKLRMHICWGNYEGPHDHDIAVEKVMGIVLKAKPQAILFEAANPRHEHEWAAWRDAKIPADKVLVPGVIASTSNYVEHPELVAQRIERYAGIVGRERVIAGTDCGFGTFAGFGKMDPEISYKKLGALAEGARIASKRLWK